MAQRLKLFVERGLWYDGKCGWFENFRIGPSLSNWIEIARYEFEPNLEASQVHTNGRLHGVQTVHAVTSGLSLHNNTPQFPCTKTEL